MPLSDYIFDQTNVQKAIQELEALIGNINDETLPNINTASVHLNQLLSNLNQQIIPNLNDTLQSIDYLINILIISVYCFIISIIIITITYVYSSKFCSKHSEKKQL